jgi:hypothetical protein
MILSRRQMYKAFRKILTRDREAETESKKRTSGEFRAMFYRISDTCVALPTINWDLFCDLGLSAYPLFE